MGWWDFTGFQFQSTLPVWGATTNIVADSGGMPEFQSTLPVWGATRRWCPCRRE